MATKVSTFVPSSGAGVKYCSTAKIADSKLGKVRVEVSDRALTRNEHGLTAHDEQHAHRTELAHVHLLALPHGQAEFDHEHEAEEADADGGGDIGRAGEPLESATLA